VRGPRWQAERAASWAGRVGLDLASLGCFGFGSSFLYTSLFYFYLSLKLNYLNSKEILNSNPYEIKQLKIMHQHECINKVKPKKILITCETKTKLNAN